MIRREQTSGRLRDEESVDSGSFNGFGIFRQKGGCFFQQGMSGIRFHGGKDHDFGHVGESASEGEGADHSAENGTVCKMSGTEFRAAQSFRSPLVSGTRNFEGLDRFRCRGDAPGNRRILRFRVADW